MQREWEKIDGQHGRAVKVHLQVNFNKYWTDKKYARQQLLAVNTMNVRLHSAHIHHRERYLSTCKS